MVVRTPRPTREWAVLATNRESHELVELVVTAIDEADAREQADEMNFEVVEIKPEHRRYTTRVAKTIGCILVAAFFVGVRQVVAYAAGSDWPLLLLLFTELTFGVAVVALVGVVLIWFPNTRFSRLAERTSDHHLATAAIIAFAFVLLGVLTIVLLEFGLI